MLSEQSLDQVSGGVLDVLNIFKVLRLDMLMRFTRCEMLDLTGVTGFIGGVVGSLFGGVSLGSFRATGDEGHYGTVRTVGATVKPAFFGTNGVVKDQHIKVLNADDIRDLNGVHLSVGAVASLPTFVQDKLADQHGIHTGELFGLVCPTGKGMEASFSFGDGKTLLKTSSDSTIALVTGKGTAVSGIEVYGTLSLSGVEVKGVDRMAQTAYHESKK